MSRRLLTCTAGLLAGLLSAAAQAGQFDLDWYTIDGGGGTSTGGNFELSGTIGQPDAGVMSGGNFELVGGFWSLPAGAAPFPGDLNGDGCVNQSDLGILLADFGCGLPGPCPGDTDGDGDTDQSDLGIVLANFNMGPNCP